MKLHPPTADPSFSAHSTKTMSAVNAAYMAGYLDGEGTLTITRAKRPENRAGFRWMTIMAIANTHRPSLECMREMCGNGRVLCVNRGNLDKHKALYRLQFTANQVRHVLPQLVPYLLIKRQQAGLVLRFLSLVTSGRHTTAEEWIEQEELRADVQKLNRRGAMPAQEIIVRDARSRWDSEPVH